MFILNQKFELNKKLKEELYTHVFNFASNSFVQSSNLDIFNCINENFSITYSVLDAIKNANRDIWFMQPLSSEVFGSPDIFPQNEITKINPINAYGISKVTDLFLCDLYEKNFGLKIFRPILYNHESIYRGRQFFSKKIFNFANKILNNINEEADILEFYNAKSTRDWGYAKDFCSIFLDAAKKNIFGKFVLGTGNVMSVEQFIENVFTVYSIEFKKVSNDEGLIEFYNNKDKLIAKEISRDLVDEKRNLIADNSALKTKLNFNELISGKELIQNLHNDYQSE